MEAIALKWDISANGLQKRRLADFYLHIGVITTPRNDCHELSTNYIVAKLSQRFHRSVLLIRIANDPQLSEVRYSKVLPVTLQKASTAMRTPTKP